MLELKPGAESGAPSPSLGQQDGAQLHSECLCPWWAQHRVGRPQFGVLWASSRESRHTPDMPGRGSTGCGGWRPEGLRWEEGLEASGNGGQ